MVTLLSLTSRTSKTTRTVNPRQYLPLQGVPPTLKSLLSQIYWDLRFTYTVDGGYPLLSQDLSSIATQYYGGVNFLYAIQDPF